MNADFIHDLWNINLCVSSLPYITGYTQNNMFLYVGSVEKWAGDTKISTQPLNIYCKLIDLRIALCKRNKQFEIQFKRTGR
jgi:hypothetical protein